MKFLFFACLFALLCFTLAGGAYKENVPYGYYDGDGSSVPRRDISTNDENDFDLNEGLRKDQRDEVDQMQSQLDSFFNNNLAKEDKRKKDSLLDTTSARKKDQQKKLNALRKNKAATLDENERRNKNNMNFQKNNQDFEDFDNKVSFRNRNDDLDQNAANRSNKNRAQKEFFDNTRKRASATHQTSTNAFDQDSGIAFKGFKSLGGFSGPSHSSKYGHSQKHKFDNDFDDQQKLKKSADSYNNASHKNLRKRKNDKEFDKKNSKKRANKDSVRANKDNDSYNKNKRAHKLDQIDQKNLVDKLSTNDLVKVLKKLSTAQLSKLLAAKKEQLKKKNAKNRASHDFNQNRKLAKDLGNNSKARKD